MTVNIRLEEADRLAHVLSPETVDRIIRASVKGGAAHVKGKVAKYPGASGGTSRRWYERGYGTKYRRKDGTISGRKTSEALGRKWTIELTNGGKSAIVGNNVSYGPYVQARDHQNHWHGAHGWKTVEDVAEEEAPTVARIFADNAEREMRKAAG